MVINDKDYCSLLTIVIQNLRARWKLQLTNTHIPLIGMYKEEIQREKESKGHIKHVLD